MSDLIPISNIHPIFQDCSFINDAELKDHIFKVMRDDTIDANLSGGLEGRVITSQYSNCLCQLIDCIVRFFQKVWHNMCMACCSDYRNKFNHAAEKITLASRNNPPPSEDPVAEERHQSPTSNQESLIENDTQLSIDEQNPSSKMIEQKVDEVSRQILEGENNTQTTTSEEDSVFSSFSSTSKQVQQQYNQESQLLIEKDIQSTPVKESNVLSTDTTVPEMNPAPVSNIPFVGTPTPTRLLQNSISLDELDRSDSIPSTPAISANTKMLTLNEMDTFLKEKGLNMVAEMLILLFGKIDSGTIESFTVDEANQTFSAHLSESVRLYVPTKIQDGGAYFLIGGGDKTVSGTWVVGLQDFESRFHELNEMVNEKKQDVRNAYLQGQGESRDVKGLVFTKGMTLGWVSSTFAAGLRLESQVKFFMQLTKADVMIGYSVNLHHFGLAQPIEKYREEWEKAEIINAPHQFTPIDEAKKRKASVNNENETLVTKMDDID